MISKVEIYGKDNCKFCTTAQIIAKRLQGTEIVYKKLGVDYNDELVAQLKEQHNHNTFPFVFVDCEFIGGAQELAKLINKR